MESRIRKAKRDDASALYEAWRTAVADTHDFLSKADHAAIARLVREQYLPSADLDVAVDGQDRPLAFMGMTGREIDALFVHASARGKGVGRALVELAMSRYPALTTEVNEQNLQGIGFWTHVGFRPTGRSELDGQGRPYPLVRMAWP